MAFMGGKGSGRKPQTGIRTPAPAPGPEPSAPEPGDMDEKQVADLIEKKTGPLATRVSTLEKLIQDLQREKEAMKKLLEVKAPKQPREKSPVGPRPGFLEL